MLNDDELSHYFFENIQSGCVIVSCGGKGSGKSTFMLAILHNSVDTNQFEDYILIFPSLYVEQHDAYKWCMKKKQFTMYTDYHPIILERLYKRNIDIKKQKKTLLIIDDATTFAKDLRLATNKSLTALISQARHLKITTWLLVHSLKNILSPCLRENVGYLIIYSITNAKLLKDVWEEYLSVFVSYDRFIEWYNNVSREEHSSFLLKTLLPVGVDTNSNKWAIVEKYRNIHLKNEKIDNNNIEENADKNKSKIRASIQQGSDNTERIQNTRTIQEEQEDGQSKVHRLPNWFKIKKW